MWKWENASSRHLAALFLKQQSQNGLCGCVVKLCMVKLSVFFVFFPLSTLTHPIQQCLFSHWIYGPIQISHKDCQILLKLLCEAFLVTPFWIISFDKLLHFVNCCFCPLCLSADHDLEGKRVQEMLSTIEKPQVCVRPIPITPMINRKMHYNSNNPLGEHVKTFIYLPTSL